MTLVPPSIPEPTIVLARRGRGHDGAARGHARSGGAVGLRRDRAGDRPHLSDRDRLARQAASRRLARHLVALPGGVDRRHRRPRRHRDRDRAGRCQLGAGGPGRRRDRHVARVLPRGATYRGAASVAARR